MGSDVARDGMFLELWDGPSNELALWAFFSELLCSPSPASSEVSQAGQLR